MLFNVGLREIPRLVWQTTKISRLSQQKQLQQHLLSLLQKRNFHHSSTQSYIITTTRRNLSWSGFSKFFNKLFLKMDDPKKAGAYTGVVDRFNGVTVDSAEEYDENDCFKDKLKKSIDFWTENKKRAIWFKVRPEHSEWIPILIKNGFEFHHAKKDFVSLQRWLPKDEYANLPDYAHTLIGVGGLVINPEKNEVLVITDRFAMIPGSWKLPGGYVDPKENLIEAAKREVKEETGVETVFRTMVALRHSHGGNFGCSDLYFVVGLTPITHKLEPCAREIARAAWMPITEYLEHPNVHETNRLFVKIFLDYECRGVKHDCITAVHQILKKEYQLYYGRAIEEHEKVKAISEQEEKLNSCEKKC